MLNDVRGNRQHFWCLNLNNCHGNDVQRKLSFSKAVEIYEAIKKVVEQQLREKYWLIIKSPNKLQEYQLK